VAQRVVLPSEAYFYSEGDACGTFAIVGRGDIRVFKLSESGREITLYHVEDGQPCRVNMLCVFLDRPAMVTAQVEATTEAVVLPAAAFREWVRTSEPMRRFIFETMAERMVDVLTLVEEIAFRKMDTRIAELLLRRFAGEHELMTTHQELGAELGTAREVVSRVLKELERHGAVELRRGRIILRDRAMLVELCGTGG
jgi:CRP/FNR family transcriptional regulator, anaerobic regulatory protein